MTLPTKAALLPVDRDALCRLIEHHCPDCNDTTGIPNGTEVEWLADQVIKFFTPAPNRPALPDDVGAVVEQSAAWVKLLRDHSAKTPEGLRIDPEAVLALATLIETLVADREGVEWAWLAKNRRASLAYYSPVYGDDDDDVTEWRVTLESGSINDREFDIIGRGQTPREAVAAAIRERGGR